MIKKVLSPLFAIAALSPGLITFCRAQAPSSIAGYSYRDQTYRTSLDLYQNAIEFHSDGTYISRALINIQPVVEAGTYAAPTNGTYSYTSAGSSQATVTLNPTGGPAQSLSLTFTDAANGTVSRPFNGITYTETFSATPTAGSGALSLLDISTLVTVQQGSSATIGFVVGGTQTREFLIRCVGPSLSSFGVGGLSANPTYQLSASGKPPAYVMPGETGGLRSPAGATGWSATAASTATISAEAARVGAFPLLSGSSDKADVWLLAPGAYTIYVNPVDAINAGSCLVEVYEVP